MAGETLASFALEPAAFDHIGVKEAVFPFARFPGVDTVLGPEMKINRRGDGHRPQLRHRLCQEPDRRGLPAAARGHRLRLGPGRRQAPGAGGRSPSGLARVPHHCDLGHPALPRRAGAAAGRINKVLEGRPHIVDAIANGEVQLVFNTTEGATALADSRSLRRAALLHKVPYYTTLSGAVAAAQGIKAYLGGDLEVRALQSYFGGKAVSGKPGPAA